MKAATAALVGATTANATYLYNQTLDTQYGKIQGVPALNATCCSYLEGYESVTVFRGIPFAATTGGENRFKEAQPAPKWNGTKLANTFGSACSAGSAPYGGADTITDEDCLNLNIWTSANSTTEKRPVMIWSYPAGGNGAWSMFDGSAMALQDIIVVTYNYRSGPFGWLALPELYEESGNKTTGNYGFLDQVAALQWIQDNIEDFGGDPKKVTTVGQSAGSAAVYHAINSPLTKGLIVGAISESGVRDPRDPVAETVAEGYNNMTTSVELSRQLMSELNVTTLAELRTVSAADMNQASTFTAFSNWRSTVDGYAFEKSYWDWLQSGPGNDIPVISGNTKDESGSNIGATESKAAFKEFVEGEVVAFADEWLAAYGYSDISNTSVGGMDMNLVYRDLNNVGTWSWGKLWSETASSPFWNYYWDHAPPGQDRGAFHMSEITYIFNNLYGTDYAWEDSDYEIAQTLNAYWANFIKNQNPNVGDSYKKGNASLPHWEPHSSENATVFHLAPARPVNENGLPVGYQQVPVAADYYGNKGDKVKMIEKFFEYRYKNGMEI